MPPRQDLLIPMGAEARHALANTTTRGAVVQELRAACDSAAGGASDGGGGSLGWVSEPKGWFPLHSGESMRLKPPSWRERGQASPHSL